MAKTQNLRHFENGCPASIKRKLLRVLFSNLFGERGDPLYVGTQFCLYDIVHENMTGWRKISLRYQQHQRPYFVLKHKNLSF